MPELIGTSAVMMEVYRRTRRAADSDASVLLLGETGTGKELIATALHRWSKRASGPMVKVNCGALADSLLESELFGHVRGSFTDAVRDRAGRFEAAHTGTIFLDEVNSTSTKLQVKLLRVLQERQFERLGDSRTIQVDVRVVAASNRDLNREIAEGRFREDLFWRLNVIPIELPPLRRRRDDIPLLAEHFVRHYGQLNQRPVTRIEPDAMRALREYSWPGNVRELQNYIERAVVLAEGNSVTLGLLPGVVTGQRQEGMADAHPTDPRNLIRDLVYGEIAARNGDDGLHEKIVDPVERELIAQVMHACNNVQIKAAQRLGMNRNTLHKKLKQYGLEG
jgi:DNA-binding NtrC family response regulator